MSAVSNEGGEGNQEVELNIAPIIDCFTVLIAYLIVSASFLSLTIFDVQVAASGEAPTPSVAMPKDPPLSLTISLKADNIIGFKLEGGAEHYDLKNNFAKNSNNQFDLVSLRARLEDLQKKSPLLEEVNLSADAGVIYRDVIKTIETIKPIYPKVFLSGEKVALSNTSDQVSGQTDEKQIH